MNPYIIFSALLMVASVVALGFYQLWQGVFAGRNYMKNEYDIDTDDEDDDISNKKR